MKGSTVKFAKNFLVIACMVSSQLSYSSTDVDLNNIVLTEKEAQLIKTNRVFEKLNAILKPIDKAQDWSIRHEATTPSKSEAIQLAAPLFAQALQDIMAEYATSYETTTVKSFGLVELQELCIVDNKESNLKIISNSEFMKILDKAMKLFEAETNVQPFVKYTAQFLIEVAGQSLTLHEVKEAIVRATV